MERTLPSAGVQDWSPHLNSIWRAISNPRRQFQKLEMNIMLILHLCMIHVVHVSNTMWRIKNQPSNSMPYACWFLWRAYNIEDFKWRLHFHFGVAFWRVVFEIGMFWRAKPHWKGIEDFNLEHCLVILKFYMSFRKFVWWVRKAQVDDWPLVEGEGTLGTLLRAHDLNWWDHLQQGQILLSGGQSCTVVP